MKNCLYLLLKLFCALAFLCSCETTQNRSKKTAQELFEKAQSQARKGYYLEAAEVISKLKYQYPYDPLSVKADLLSADIAYDQGEWEQAEKAYQIFTDLYPRHKDREYAYFRRILSLNRQIPQSADRDISLSQKALKVIDLFQKVFPKSRHLSKVKKMRKEIYDREAEKEFKIAKFYFKKKKYQASLNRLDVVIQKYKKSSWLSSAQLLAQKIARILKDSQLEKKYSKKIRVKA